MTEPIFFFSDWTSLARIIFVGVFGYIALLFLFRISSKRSLAKMNAFDFIVTVALGSAFGRALTAKGVPLAEALLAFALLTFLRLSVSWLVLRSKKFAKLVQNAPTLVFYDGSFLKEAMRKEKVREEDLKSSLRHEGLASFSKVRAIVFEPDGSFSVIKKQEGPEKTSYQDIFENSLKE